MWSKASLKLFCSLVRANKLEAARIVKANHRNFSITGLLEVHKALESLAISRKVKVSDLIMTYRWLTPGQRPTE